MWVGRQKDVMYKLCVQTVVKILINRSWRMGYTENSLSVLSAGIVVGVTAHQAIRGTAPVSSVKTLKKSG